MGMFFGWMLDTRYWVEWVVSITVIVLTLWIAGSVEPRHRLFPMPDGVLDPQLSFPREPSIVPILHLWIAMLIIPFAVVAMSINFGASWLDVHHVVLSIIEGTALSHAFTDSIQVMTGRLRPTWFERIEDDSGIKSGRLSYPSGHAAYSTTAMTVLSLYLFSKTKVFRRDRYQLPLAVYSLSPLAVSVFISTSRVMDHHHHFADINAAMFIGTFTGLAGFLLNYPPPWNRNTGKPHTRGSRILEQALVQREEERVRHVHRDDKGQTPFDDDM